LIAVYIAMLALDLWTIDAYILVFIAPNTGYTWEPHKYILILLHLIFMQVSIFLVEILFRVV